MKKLSEKFDHLPQEFDREAIWKGIEKPKRPFIYQSGFWVGFLLVVSGVLFFVFSFERIPVSTSVASNTSKIKAISAEEKITTLLEGQEPTIYFNTHLLLDLLAPAVSQQLEQTKKKEKRAPVISGSTKEEAIETEGTTTKESGQNKQEAIPDTKQIADKKITEGIHRLPGFIFPVEKTSKDQYSSYSPTIIRKKKRIIQSLSVRGGIGLHQSDFSSSAEEDPKWREQLEQPQLDYSLGLRYELLVWHDFLVSLSTTYHLYKDQINTDYRRESVVQDTLVTYQLYNHYHLFSGRLQVGRRFYHKRFFWDIQGGLGLSYRQTVEADYFVNEGALAEQEQVEAVYQNTGDIFFTGQAAIGQHIGNRLMLRMGTQFNSGVDLTGPQAAIRHRILSMNAFLELGIRF